MVTTDELAGLPEDVREHVANMDASNTVNGSWNAIRAELLRLARKNADLASQVEGWKLEALRRSTYRDRAERAEAELAAIKATPTGTVLDWALRRAEKAEAELAALKRSPQGTVQAVRPQADGCYLVEVRCDSAGVASLFSQRVALLPVGGETK